MAKERRRWVIYYDGPMEKHVERLIQESAKKDHVLPGEVSKRQVIADVLREKYIEYVDKQNNRARITDIVERLMAVEKAVKELTEALQEANHDLPTPDSPVR